MNILRYSLLTAMLALSQHTFANPTEDLLENPEFKADIDAWSQANVEKFKGIVSNGYDISDVNNGAIKFIREHAEELGKELEYLLDHPNAQVNMLVQYECNKLLNSIETFFKTADFSSEQTLAALLQNPQSVTLLADVIAFWSAIKHLAPQAIPADSCPLVNQALAKVVTLESIYADLFPILHKHAAKLTIPAVPQETVVAIQNGCSFAKVAFAAITKHAQTAECTAHFKQVTRAAVAFLQEDSFFEMLAFNAECRKKGDWEQQKPFMMPESFQMLMEAVDAHNVAWSQALSPLEEEFQKLFPTTTYYRGDDEENCSECSECDFEIECCDDDCVEYDFNEQFKRNHAA